jgi:streptomycin 6-kinase
MTKPIDERAIAGYVDRWQIEPAAPPFATHSSVLLPALQHGVPVMLKLTPEPDEIRGGHLLAWWKGQGAVRVLEQEEGALLMERPLGKQSLVEMSLQGRDEESIEILCSVAAELHAPNSRPLPPLEPIEQLFEPLLASSSIDSVIRAGKVQISDLLAHPIDRIPLHGDLQHYNVLDAGEGRWLAIDPKGQIGERTYDFSNLFRNPTADIGNQPETFERRLRQISNCAALDPIRLCRWIAAFCTLSLVWDYYPQGSPDSDRTLALLALSHL